MIDLALLDDAIAWAEEHPDQDHVDADGSYHRQNTWISENGCGTACCLAGRVVLMRGWHLTTGLTAYVQHPDAGVLTVYDAAREELGIDHETADALFEGGNTIEVLKRLAKDLANGERVDLDIAQGYLLEEEERSRA